MSDTVFVYTMTQLGSVGAWSRYEFDWKISDFAQLGDHLYMRHGDIVSVVVEAALTDEVLQVEGDPGTFEDATDPPVIDGFHTAMHLNDAVLVVGHLDTPYISIFEREGWVKYPDPADLPPPGVLHGGIYGVTATSDGTYVAVSHEASPYITIYKRDAYGLYNKLSNPASLPGGPGADCAFSDDGNYLAVTFMAIGALGVAVYRRDGDTFTKLPALPGPTNNLTTRLAYSGAELAVGCASPPYLLVWRQVGDAFSPVTLNGGALTGKADYLAFSATKLAVTTAYAPYVAVYNRGASFTRLPTPASPPDLAGPLAFSSDGAVLVIGRAIPPRVHAYTVDGDTLTPFDPEMEPGAQVRSIAFHGDRILFGTLDAAPATWSWAGVEGTSEHVFKGILHWPWLDFGRPGVNKMLVGFDHVGTGTAKIEIGYDQSNLATFTPEYAIPSDTVPGLPTPFWLSAPSLSVKVTFDGSQDWQWNQTTIYLSDGRVTT